MNSQPNFAERLFRMKCVTAASVVVLLFAGSATADIFNAAENFNLTDNPNGTFAYGYLDNSVGHTAFLTTDVSDGFVNYPNAVDPSVNGQLGSGWTFCLDGPSCGFFFPISGTLNVPDALPAAYPGFSEDVPTSAGENSDYPFGVIGGHSPTNAAAIGYYALEWTAPAGHSGPVDLEFKAWQAGIYPEVSHGGANNPQYGGNVRPQQILVQKVSGANTESIAKGPMKARHGFVNLDGTPQYTAENTAANAARNIFVDVDGDPATFTTTPGDATDCTSGNGFSAGCDGQGEITAAIGSSRTPTTHRLTNVDMNAGDSITVSLAAMFDSNQAGFFMMDLQVFRGADRTATEKWDLAGDWSVHGSTADDVGPDSAWSYGTQKSGSFAPFDQVRYGGINAGSLDPVDQHGWGTVAPGWFDSDVVRSEDLETVVPGIMVDYDGRNFTREANGEAGDSVDHVGDWSGGKLVIHTPPATFDAEQTSTIRWTAPDNLTVDVEGGLWRALLPDSEGEGEHDHEFELLHNGSSVLGPTLIDDLNFDCASGSNSFCPVPLELSGLSVSQGDTLDLLIRPVDGATETFIGVDFSVLMAIVSGTPGDFNGDGFVDAADYTVWQDHIGATEDGLVLNGNGDGGTVGASDYNLWVANFGNPGTGSSAELASAVPEPTSLVLITLASLASVMFRRPNSRLK